MVEDSSEESSAHFWLQQASPSINSLVTTTSTALLTLKTGQEKQAAAVDHIRSSALTLQRWLATHPCPDPTLADRCEVFVARYRFVCLEIESNRKGASEGRFEAMIERLGFLNAEFAKVLVDPQ